MIPSLRMSPVSHTDFSVTILFLRKVTLWLVVLLDTLKYSHKPVAMVQCGIITYIKCLETADYYPQCGRRSDGCTSTITHDLKSIVTRLTNKAVSPGQMDSPTNDKNC